MFGAGAVAAHRAKSAATAFSDSPTYLEKSSGPCTSMKPPARVCLWHVGSCQLLSRTYSQQQLAGCRACSALPPIHRMPTCVMRNTDKGRDVKFPRARLKGSLTGVPCCTCITRSSALQMPRSTR